MSTAKASATVGRNGRGVLTLESAPSASTGRVGDFAIVVSGGLVQSIYGPKTEDGWGDPTLLPGLTVLSSGTSAPSADLGRNGDYAVRISGGVVTFYGPKASNAWPAGYRLNGATVLTGTSAPSNSLGADGDIHFESDGDGAAVAWRQKASGAWGSPRDMRGPARAAIATVSVTADRTIGESDLGKCLVVDSASTVTLTFPNTIAEAGWSVIVRRKGNGAVILAAGSGATIAFQFSGDDRIAKVNGTVSVDNINGATAWVVSEGTAAA